MGWKEDLRDIGLNMVTLGGYGIGRALAGQRESESKDTYHSAISFGPGAFDRPTIKPPPTVAVPKPGATSAAPSTAPPQACCDRYRIVDGYMIDGAQGSVWRINAEDNTLDELPRRDARSKEALKEMLVEMELNRIAAGYECEVLAGLSTAQRAAELKQFDQRYLAPLRSAMLNRPSQGTG